MKDHFKLYSAVIAVGVYLFLVTIVFYYFNYRNSKKSLHYVAKSSRTLSVTLTASGERAPKKVDKKKVLQKKSRKHQQKVRNISSKNPQKQKSKRQKKSVKKVKTKSLFASVKTRAKPDKKREKRSIQGNKGVVLSRNNSRLKKEEKQDKGIENKYFASIEAKLRGWPAQVNYAGETISVQLTVYRTGAFDFQVKRHSANSEFNKALVAYLKQLQSIGLGSHNNEKPYEIEVLFEATE